MDRHMKTVKKITKTFRMWDGCRSKLTTIVVSPDDVFPCRLDITYKHEGETHKVQAFPFRLDLETLCAMNVSKSSCARIIERAEEVEESPEEVDESPEEV